VFVVGNAVVAPDKLYDVNVFGCAEVPGTSARYFAATPSPAKEWVAFEHRVKPVTGRLGVGYWTGSDGSQLIDGAWLLEQDVRCNSEIDESQNERCIPTNRVQVDPAFYTDSTCTTKVAASFVCEAALITATPQNPPDPACRGTSISGDWFVATPIDARLVHRGIGSVDRGCMPSEFGGFKYFAPGAAVVLDALPPIERARGGSERIQRVFWTSEGKALYADGLYDTALGSECHAVATSKGTVCEAVGEIVGQYFADPTCTVPLYADWPSCTARPKFVRSAESPGDACNGAGASRVMAQPVRRFLSPHEGDIYVTRSGTALRCESSYPPPGGVLYDLSELMPPEEAFAPVATPEF
jgi:hypothetical protein